MTEENTSQEIEKQDPETPVSTSTNNVEEELIKMTELAKRTMADFQNFKRRQEEERSQIYFSANSGLIKSLLPTYDNLERALQHAPQNLSENEETKKWLSGLEMSIGQIKNVFTLAGLTEIEAAGKTFDPEKHEALLEGAGEKNQIIEVLEKGYLLGDKVIRHAKVKVGNGENIQ